MEVDLVYCVLEVCTELVVWIFFYAEIQTIAKVLMVGLKMSDVDFFARIVVEVLNK